MRVRNECGDVEVGEGDQARLYDDTVTSTCVCVRRDTDATPKHRARQYLAGIQRLERHLLSKHSGVCDNCILDLGHVVICMR